MSLPTADFDTSAALNSSVAEIAYEQRAYSDSVRLPKNAKVLGAAANPTTECNLAVVATDGRVILVDLLGDVADRRGRTRPSPLRTLESFLPPTTSAVPASSGPLRLLTTGMLSGLPAAPFVVRMCPALTMKNMAEYRPIMAVGASCGNIQASGEWWSRRCR